VDAVRGGRHVTDGSPSGNERPYDALHQAMSPAKEPEAGLQVFPTGDGVSCTGRLP
jgi:hypothetical protein